MLCNYVSNSEDISQIRKNVLAALDKQNNTVPFPEEIKALINETRQEIGRTIERSNYKSELIKLILIELATFGNCLITDNPKEPTLEIVLDILFEVLDEFKSRGYVVKFDNGKYTISMF